ncbi:MAG: DUF3037 domain-containing protein [Mucilaginibacter sp.]
MNKGTFSFALLQYHHSQILGEILNIGLIAYFPDQKETRFIYPEKLIRLRFAYPDIPEKTIKNYFKFFNDRVCQLNSQPEFFTSIDLEHSLETFLNNELIGSDSSSLQFGKIKKSVLYTNNIDAITNQLYNLYFSVFYQHENIVHRVDEITLLNRYKNLFNEIRHGKDNEVLRLDKIRYDYQVTANSGNTVKFDIAWQSSNELHLVKPIGFDLIKPEAITAKAYRYYGQFTDLETLADRDSLNFDVLLSKPTKKPLFKAYDNATRLLSTPKSVKLVEYEGIKQYAQATLEQLQFEI